jgi:putative two-component system protein, hydrogenase maturation factor HypX/HoxX
MRILLIASAYNSTTQRVHAALADRGHEVSVAQVAALAEELAASPGYPARLVAKGRQLAAAEKQRPLAAYRAAELAIMRRNFSAPRAISRPAPGLRLQGKAAAHPASPGPAPE